MRHSLLAAVAVSSALLAPRGMTLSARPVESVTIHVRSLRAGEPVEFAVRYFGEGLKPGAANDHLKTPYDLTVTGAEVHALFRQTGGTGTMQLDLKLDSGASGSIAGPIGLAVVANGHLAITGFDH